MRGILALILALFAVLGVLYSVVAPPFEVSDEVWHYPVVKLIADEGELPVQDPANPGPWGWEGSQPPLYYAVAAAVTFWIDTSDMEAVRVRNPQADIGVATADGNVNLVVHDPALEAFPWRGTVLAVHLVRLLSVGMGAATVYVTYRLARELFPDRALVALAAAAINAFTPMFVFISGSVNNDNLAVLLCSLALLAMVRMMNGEPEMASGKGRRAFVVPHLSLGLVLGLAALTKESALGLFLPATLAVTVRVWHQRAEVPPVRRLGLVIGHLSLMVLPALAVAGWWYWRNWRLYGDPLGWNVLLDIVGGRAVPADLAQLWSERYSFLAGYWGNFGGVNVPMASWAYAVLNTAAVIAGLGLLVALFKGQVRRRKGRDEAEADERRGPGAWTLVPVLLWPPVLLASYTRFAGAIPASQGRLVFPGISVWSLLLSLGLSGWLPRRWGRWVAPAFALFLFGLSVAAPLAWIRPAYALPEPLTEAELAGVPHPLKADFAGVMRLLGYDLGTEAVKPGGQVEVTLYWEAIAPAERDYTVFVHLLGEGELVVAQRDTYPGLGKLSTRWLEPGFRWADPYVLRVPRTAYAPDLAQVEVGLYDLDTGERLLAVGRGAEQLGDNVRFGQVEVRGSSEDVPNPVFVNFGDRMALVGYDLDRRVVQPGGEVTMTLYWQGLRPMERNYTISVQLVDESRRKAAQEDSWPQEGAAPTAGWEANQALVGRRTLGVYPDAVPGVYDVRLMVYVVEDGELVHLPVIPRGGRRLSEHVVLTRVRVQ